MNFRSEIVKFRDALMQSGGVLEPPGEHSEFAGGMHGRKLDFDRIVSTDPLYEQWVSVTAGYLEREFINLPDVVIGVANGTNRLALDTAHRFKDEVLGLCSEKDACNSKILRLGQFALRAVRALEPELAVVLEDVGTTGSNSVQVALAAQAAGAKRVEVVATWQRRPVLEKLEEAGITYRAIINELIPTYTREECRDHGYCAQGWELKDRKTS